MTEQIVDVCPVCFEFQDIIPTSVNGLFVKKDKKCEAHSPKYRKDTAILGAFYSALHGRPELTEISLLSSIKGDRLIVIVQALRKRSGASIVEVATEVELTIKDHISSWNIKSYSLEICSDPTPNATFNFIGVVKSA